jgi:predicted nucleic acid-binding protein
MAMPKLVVIDTSVLFALVDTTDKWHERAIGLLSALKTNYSSVIYFDCVLNETISAIARRAREQKRADQFPALLQRIEQLVPEELITWISKEVEHLYHEVASLVGRTNGRLNFHDALIVLACRDLDIPNIVSFDEDFDEITWVARVAKPEELSEL